MGYSLWGRKESDMTERLHFLKAGVGWGRIISIWEKAMAPHSSTLAWRVPWTEDPGGLQSMGSRRVRHD